MKTLAIFSAYYFFLAIRYFAIAGGATLYLRKVYAFTPAKKQIQTEIKNSLASFIIYSIIGTIMVVSIQSGITRVYQTIEEHGLAYLGLSVLGMLLFHDVYFYITHRLMHESKWLSQVHSVHHVSVQTTPYSSFSFHPIEALITSGAGIVFLFIVPLHPIAFFIFQVVMVGFNIIGHMGVDLFKSSTHALHHLKGRGNYGLYTTLWDRWLKTELKPNRAQRPVTI